MSANIQHLHDKTVLFCCLNNTVPKSQLLSKASKYFAWNKDHMSTVEVLEIFKRNRRTIVLTVKVMQHLHQYNPISETCSVMDEIKYCTNL